jgi:hypothetical protein
MGKWKFEPEDFVCETGLARNRAAELANAKLAEWLRDAPEMYCRQSPPGTQWKALWQADEAPSFARATHTAKLINIKPTEKK